MSSQLPDVIRGEESCDEDTEDDARSSKEPLRSSKEPPLERMSSQEPKTSVTSSSSGQGMSRSVSDTTLRKHALHLNLSQSVLPSFTPLHQFKVCKVYKDPAKGWLLDPS